MATFFDEVDCPPETFTLTKETVAEAKTLALELTTPNVTYSSDHVTTPRPLDQDEIIMAAILYYSSRYAPPIVIMLGLAGNILAYLVLRLPRYRRSSNCCYMRSLAIFDNITLIGRYVQRYIYMVWPDVLLTDPVVAEIFCREFLFISYVYMSIAHWTLSFMALDRLIAVSFPLKAKAFCTVKRAMICIGINFVILNIIFLPNLLRAYNPDGITLTTRCPLTGIFDWYAESNNILYYGVCHTVPVVILSFSNLGIVVVVKRNRTRRDSMTIVVNKNERRTERNITVMLLLVSWTFVVLLLPVVVDYFFWDVIRPIPIEGKTASIRKFTYEFIRIPRMLNSACNFYLYFLGCKRFRQDLRSILSKGKDAWKSEHNRSSSRFSHDNVKIHSRGSGAGQRNIRTISSNGLNNCMNGHSFESLDMLSGCTSVETLNTICDFVLVAEKDEVTRL